MSQRAVDKQKSILSMKKYVVYVDDRQKLSQEIMMFIKPFDILVFVQPIKDVQVKDRREWMVPPCLYKLETHEIFQNVAALNELKRFWQTTSQINNGEAKEILASSRVSGYESISDYNFRKAVNDDTSTIDTVCGKMYEVYERDPRVEEIRVCRPDEKATQEKVNEYIALRIKLAIPSLQAWDMDGGTGAASSVIPSQQQANVINTNTQRQAESDYSRQTPALSSMGVQQHIMATQSGSTNIRGGTYNNTVQQPQPQQYPQQQQQQVYGQQSYGHPQQQQQVYTQQQQYQNQQQQYQYPPQNQQQQYQYPPQQKNGGQQQYYNSNQQQWK